MKPRYGPTRPMSAPPWRARSPWPAPATGSSGGGKRTARCAPPRRARNVLIGRVRGRVEGVFGALKRSYGLARLRYMSLARNTAGVLLTLTGWNLARAADRWRPV